jgi:hypothetical protein
MLMVQSELDPATAYEGSPRTHQDTARATRFVAIDDEGMHGQYVGGPSACTEAIGDRFVFGGELPGKDQVCGTSPLPAELSVYPVDGPVDGNAVHLPRSKAATQADRPNPVLQRVLDTVANNSAGSATERAARPGPPAGVRCCRVCNERPAIRVPAPRPDWVGRRVGRVASAVPSH